MMSSVSKVKIGLGKSCSLTQAFVIVDVGVTCSYTSPDHENRL